MLEDIDHSKTKARSPQTHGMCERFDKTMQDEFYVVAYHKILYKSIDELQADLDNWIDWYNNERTHSGKYCYGKTPHGNVCRFFTFGKRDNAGQYITGNDRTEQYRLLDEVVAV